MLARLRSIAPSQLSVCESYGALKVADQIPDQSEPGALIQVTDPSFYRRAAISGGLGAAESYLRGEWQANDLVRVFRVLARNEQARQAVSNRSTLLMRTVDAMRRFATENTLRGSRKNIHAHYDLGNDFFKLFLDPTMTYSSGYFEHPEASMEEASVAKYDRVCQKLGLSPGQKVVEIGTGWGGFAEHAARHYGCHVTTTTISREQYTYARQRIHRANLADRVTLLNCDYRDLPMTCGREQFDALASIEMIEAVGHRYLPTYFRTCESLVRPGGKMAFQAITIPDQRYERYRRSVDFIQRYIFPGGCLPSLGSICRALSKTSRSQLRSQEDFGLHYARTLAIWRERFWSRLSDVQALGLDDRFVRMWDYYLAYCEAGFRERMIGVSWLVVGC